MKILRHILKYTGILILLSLFVGFYSGYFTTSIGILTGMPKSISVNITSIIILISSIIINFYCFYRQALVAPRYPYWSGLIILLLFQLRLCLYSKLNLVWLPFEVLCYLIATPIGVAKRKRGIKPTLENPAINSINPFYYPVSITKLTLMIVTFGLYKLYWWYQNWTYIKSRDGKNISPVLRSIFAVFFYSEFLKDINKNSSTHNQAGIKFPSLFVILYVIFVLVTSIFGLMIFIDKSIAIYVSMLAALDLCALILFITPQLAINRLNKSQNVPPNNKITIWNICFIFLGLFILQQGLVSTRIASRTATENAYIFNDYGNYKAAYRFAIKAADENDPKAQYLLSQLYFSGHGTQRDEIKAIAWVTKSADQGYVEAQYYLGTYYDTGINTDYSKAAKWYQKAYESGHAFAATNLGFLYKHGTGVPKDDKKALELYQFAANKGDTTAMYNVGSDYKNNAAIPNHYTLAAVWFQKAAEHNSREPCATNDLGMLYAVGNGVQKDEAKAKEFFTKTASRMRFNILIEKNHQFYVDLDMRNVSRESMLAAFSDYQYAKANHINNIDELTKMYSSATVDVIKNISNKLVEVCWQ